MPNFCKANKYKTRVLSFIYNKYVYIKEKLLVQ